MKGFRRENNTLIWERNHEIVLIQSWGRDSLRVQSTRGPEVLNTPGALLSPIVSEPHIEIGDRAATIQNGKIKAEVSIYGRIRFPKSSATH